jgi:hypothetical protein
VSDYQPPAATVLDWLRSNLGPNALAPLTGSDVKALRAATQIMEAYGYDRHPALMDAFALVVSRMQSKCRHLAYHAIAHPLDWSDRAKIWMAIGNVEIPSSKCSFEPGGPRIDLSEEECPKCGQRVPHDEWDEHAEAHLNHPESNPTVPLADRLRSKTKVTIV